MRILDEKRDKESKHSNSINIIKMKQDLMYKTAIYIASKIIYMNQKCGGPHIVTIAIPVGIFAFLQHCTHLMDGKNTASQLENTKKSEYVINLHKSPTNPDKTHIYPYEKMLNSIDSNMILMEHNNVRKDKIFNLEEYIMQSEYKSINIQTGTSIYKKYSYSRIKSCCFFSTCLL